MRSRFQLLGCCLGVLIAVAPAAAQSGQLLPTAQLAKQVNALTVLLSDSPKGTRVESRRKQGFLVRDRISQFVIDQIAAKPDITKEQLRAQLYAILCSNLHGESECFSPPYVFSNWWFGPKGTMQFAVAYQLELGFMGPEGSITVVESYVVEDSKARHAARGANEFDAYFAHFQIVAQFTRPDEIWVLAWGPVLGGNGRGITGRATVYRVGVDAVQVAWDDTREVSVSAQKSLIGWEFSYANKQMLYANDPQPYFFDVYEIDYSTRNFSRVVHYRHNGNSL